MPNFDFDAADIARVSHHLPARMPGPTYDEMAAYWPADRRLSRNSADLACAEAIVAARAARYAQHGPTKYRLAGDWMDGQGQIANLNRPRRIVVYCDLDGRWWSEDQYGPDLIGAYACGDDAPLVISVPGPAARLIDVLCMGGFSPDNGELARVGMPVRAV